MENVLKEDITIKYNQALKLQDQNEKDEELLKRIPQESENLFSEYKAKYKKILMRKASEIKKLEKQIQEYEQKVQQNKQKLDNLPNYIKKLYRI